MSNSKLVNHIHISPNRTSPRRNRIDRITIHHMAGNLTVETCGNVFAPRRRQASSNYGIGSDGRVGMYVEEKIERGLHRLVRTTTGQLQLKSQTM